MKKENLVVGARYYEFGNDYEYRYDGYNETRNCYEFAELQYNQETDEFEETGFTRYLYENELKDLN